MALKVRLDPAPAGSWLGYRKAGCRPPSSSETRAPSSVPNPVLAAFLVWLPIGVLRRRQPAADLPTNSLLLPESAQFFLTLQLTIDTAWVNRNMEALGDSLGYLRTRDRRFGEPKLGHELHQFGCEFVPGTGPAFLW